MSNWINYNLFRRVLPFLTQRMGAIECQILIFRSSYSYLTLGISLQFNNVESNSYNCFPFSSSKCCSALPEAWAPAPMRSPCSNCRYVDNEYTDSPRWRAIIAAHEVRRTKKKKSQPIVVKDDAGWRLTFFAGYADCCLLCYQSDSW